MSTEDKIELTSKYLPESITFNFHKNVFVRNGVEAPSINITRISFDADPEAAAMNLANATIEYFSGITMNQ